jgi:hypothetical protein
MRTRLAEETDVVAVGLQVTSRLALDTAEIDRTTPAKIGVERWGIS